MKTFSSMMDELFPDGPPIKFCASMHTQLLGDRPGYRAWWEALSDIERANYQREVTQAEDFLRRKEEEAVAKLAQQERDLAARIEQDRIYEERRAYELPRERLVRRGIPTKDIERIVTGTLLETGAMKRARAYVDDKSIRALVLSGGRGCGKTTAASWLVAQRWGEEGEVADIFSRMCPVPLFVDVSRLSRISRYKAEEMEPLERCPLLAIDDLGMEYADEKGNFLSTLDGLFNARYAANLRTVITTNLTHAAFSKRYGERVIDRIRETGKFFEIADESLRGRTP